MARVLIGECPVPASPLLALGFGWQRSRRHSPACLLPALPCDPWQVDYFREWQADLKARYDEARQAGFDSASVAEVEAVQDRMTQVWWHVGQLKPAFLCYLAHTLLPENSGQLPLWREIAVEVMQHMDERSVGIVVGLLLPARWLGGCWAARMMMMITGTCAKLPSTGSHVTLPLCGSGPAAAVLD
jgi:hypothetical protein